MMIIIFNTIVSQMMVVLPLPETDTTLRLVLRFTKLNATGTNHFNRP
jgi:hypothetical protein